MFKVFLLLQSMRLPFLILTPICVFLGTSVLIHQHIPINWILLSLGTVGALSAHIAVNLLNEYIDFKSGLDLETKKTPFSGGSGVLPQYNEMLGLVLSFALFTWLTTLMIGGVFISIYGIDILFVGLLGVILISTYTPWLNRLPWLCLIAPGLGFGILMPVGIQFVLTGYYDFLIWKIALIPFFLFNNLLLLNQYPDIVADRNRGRRHFPISYGIDRSNEIYLLFTFASGFFLLLWVSFGELPRTSLAALAPWSLSFVALYGALKYKQNLGQFPRYLAANVAASVLTPLVLATSLLV